MSGLFENKESVIKSLNKELINMDTLKLILEYSLKGSPEDKYEDVINLFNESKYHLKECIDLLKSI